MALRGRRDPDVPTSGGRCVPVFVHSEVLEAQPMRMEMLVRGEQEVELIPQAAKEYVDGNKPTNECFFFAH